MSASPTERTLRECRRRGWIVGVVEKWVPQTRRRVDLFGFVDLVAIDGHRVVMIQATSGAHVATRRKKIDEIAHAGLVAAACDVEVWGWRKLKVKRGGVAVRWAVARWRMVAPGYWREEDA